MPMGKTFFSPSFGMVADKNVWFHAFEYTTSRITSLENALGRSQTLSPAISMTGDAAECE
jgi:hypothetical protein